MDVLKSIVARVLAEVKLTIGTKLVALIATLLVISIVAVVGVSTRLFNDDNVALIQTVNLGKAESVASQVRDLFENATEKMRMLGTVLIQEFSQPEIRERLVGEFFAKDKDFLALYVHRATDGAAPTVQNKATSPEMDAIDDKDGEKALATVLQDKNFSLSQVAKGEAQLASVKLSDGAAAVAISIPFIQVASDKFSHTLTAIVRQARFVKAFGDNDVITVFLVDRSGKLLAHPDAVRVSAGESVAHLDIVKEMLKGTSPNLQMRYAVEVAGKPEWQFGAFRMVGFAGLGVVAEVPEAKAFEASAHVKRRSMYMGFTIVCIAFFFGYLFSASISGPIRSLVEAARRISAGDFAINLKAKGQDEVASLSRAFNDMAKGLEERDRVKSTFNKFHNKEIADKLLSGEVKLGGERKEATIFFSDVRGFTGMSEAMQPEQVVEMLNEYMTRMVAIIRAHGGIVDKYVGDAIMALWGVPVNKQDDTFNAVGACLAMREDLAKLNTLRLSRGQPALKIGMGLNTGQVIAGNIGSTEKMEYTVIGDSVNLASRIESMTKEYGTDLLISENVYDQLKDEFLFEECASAKVKGKSQAIKVFKVRGFTDENGREIIVETPYSSYAAEKSDKVVHDDKHPAPAAHSENSKVFEKTGAIEMTPSGPAVITPAAIVAAAASPEKLTQPSLADEKTDPNFQLPVEAIAKAFSFDDPIIPVEAAAPTEPTYQPSARKESTRRISMAATTTVDAISPATSPTPVAPALPAIIAAAAAEPHLAPQDLTTPAELATTAEPASTPSAASLIAELGLAPEFVAASAAAPTPVAEITKTKTRFTGSTTWYIQLEGATFGPFTPTEVYFGIESHELTAEMPASISLDNPTWAPLGSYAEFGPRFRKTAQAVA